MIAGHDSLIDRLAFSGPGPCPARSWDRFKSRRGSLLAEVAIATIVLVVAMGMTVRVIATVAQERRSNMDRQQAVLEVGNLMERITAHSFEQITPEFAGRISVSDQTRTALRDCELSVRVSGGERSATGGQTTKRVTVLLRWKGRSGQWLSPVRLTAWVQAGGPHR
jgi:Tfp pilus assembly protein PilV